MKFEQKVYELVNKIPLGKVSTYKEIAEALNIKAYRAVGQALKRNKAPVIIPCHRVVKSTGEIGGYAGQIEAYSKAVKKKIMLLEKEGIKIKNKKIDLKKYLWKP